MPQEGSGHKSCG